MPTVGRPSLASLLSPQPKSIMPRAFWSFRLGSRPRISRYTLQYLTPITQDFPVRRKSFAMTVGRKIKQLSHNTRPNCISHLVVAPEYVFLQDNSNTCNLVVAEPTVRWPSLTSQQHLTPAKLWHTITENSRPSANFSLPLSWPS